MPHGNDFFQSKQTKVYLSISYIFLHLFEMIENQIVVKIELEVKVVSSLPFTFRLFLYKFFIKISDFKIECPGVWLCSAGGSVEITIRCLGYFFKTRPAPERFPILVHQVYTMEGYFQNIDSFSGMDRILGKIFITFFNK